MTKPTDMECSGCRLSMFCSRNGDDSEQGCETSLKAVSVAFLIPLLCIVLVLVVAQGQMGEGWTSLLIFALLAVYFLLIRLIKPDFRKR